MRWVTKPQSGDVRNVHKFLILPKKLWNGKDMEYRWLEWVCIEQRFSTFLWQGRWEDKKWITWAEWITKERY